MIGRKNDIWGRIHCDGTDAANNVNVTFYCVYPPGVGDNGNWAPLKTLQVASINNNDYLDVKTTWVPAVGEHTCLKVYASPQLGEVSGGNNMAQENIIEFEAPSSSVPSPVIMPVAVRNPLKERTIAWLDIKGVPEGYIVHFPHEWVWLDPLEERRYELTVIPTKDYSWYRETKTPNARVRIAGRVPRQYRDKVEPDVYPASWMMPIGGITAVVKPKRRVSLKILEDKEGTGPTIALKGSMVPELSGERAYICLTDPQDRQRMAEVKTDAQGKFKAVFDLRKAPSPDVKRKKGRAEKPQKGVYEAQAFTVNSPNAAEASSNILHITK